MFKISLHRIIEFAACERFFGSTLKNSIRIIPFRESIRALRPCATFNSESGRTISAPTPQRLPALEKFSYLTFSLTFSFTQHFNSLSNSPFAVPHSLAHSYPSHTRHSSKQQPWLPSVSVPNLTSGQLSSNTRCSASSAGRSNSPARPRRRGSAKAAA